MCGEVKRPANLKVLSKQICNSIYRKNSLLRQRSNNQKRKIDVEAEDPRQQGPLDALGHAELPHPVERADQFSESVESRKELAYTALMIGKTS